MRKDDAMESKRWYQKKINEQAKQMYFELLHTANL
jgi:hypothetical protein